MGVCSRQLSMCTWNTVSPRGQDTDFIGQRSLVATKDQMQSLKQSLLPEKSLRMDVGFMALEETFKSISRKVRIIETSKYCEKETGGHLVKKGCSDHVGNVGRRKPQKCLCSAFGPTLPSQEAVFASQTQKYLREYYPSQKKQCRKKLNSSGL